MVVQQLLRAIGKDCRGRSGCTGFRYDAGNDFAGVPPVFVGEVGSWRPPFLEPNLSQLFPFHYLPKCEQLPEEACWMATGQGCAGCPGERGVSQYLSNRVGHSIGTEVHGNGANIDNFESRDEREIIPSTCFSIEPGICLPEF